MVELSLGTILVIGLIIGGIFWVKINKPDLYEDTIDKAKDLVNKETSTETTITEGGDVNYGKPYTPFECTADVQCKTYFTDIADIMCNTITGDCYLEG